MKKKRIFSFALGPLGAAVVGIASIPVMAWVFSPEDIGRITLLQVFSALSIIVFTLGLDLAFLREYHEAEDKCRLLRSSIAPGLTLILIFSVGVLSSPQFISELLFSVSSATFSALIVTCILCGFFLRYVSLIFRAQERGLEYSAVQIVPKLLFLLVILTYACFEGSYEFFGLIFSHTISLLISAVFFLGMVRHEIYSSVKSRFDVADLANLKKMLLFGLPLVAAGFASWGMTALDKLFLRYFSSFGELGVYSIAVSVAAAVGVVTSVFNTIWAPMVFRWAAEGGDLRKIDYVSEHMAAAVFFIFVLSGLFSWLVPIFLPEDYDQARYIISACMAAPLLYALSESTGVGLSIVRRTNLSMLAALVAVSISVLINYVLVSNFGASGAAAATAITFWTFFFLKTEFCSIAWRKFPRLKIHLGTILASVTAVIVSLWGESFRDLIILLWASVGCIGIFIYWNSLMRVVSLIKYFSKRFLSSC